MSSCSSIIVFPDCYYYYYLLLLFLLFDWLVYYYYYSFGSNYLYSCGFSGWINEVFFVIDRFLLLVFFFLAFFSWSEFYFWIINSLCFRWYISERNFFLNASFFYFYMGNYPNYKYFCSNNVSSPHFAQLQLFRRSFFVNNLVFISWIYSQRSSFSLGLSVY